MNVVIQAGLHLVAHLQVKTEETDYDDFPEVQSSIKKLREEADAVTSFPSWVDLAKVRRIRNLKCFESVRDMCLSGVHHNEIARWIQSQGEMLDQKITSIIHYVTHYKSTLPKWAMVLKQTPKQMLEAKGFASKAVNVLEKYQLLLTMMENRIKLGMDVETRFGVVNSELDSMFNVSMKLLVEIQKTKEKLGLSDMDTKAAPGAATAIDQVDWGKVYARESVAKVMGNPESRARVVRVAERLFDLYGTNITDASMTPRKDLPIDPGVLSSSVDGTIEGDHEKKTQEEDQTTSQAEGESQL